MNNDVSTVRQEVIEYTSDWSKIRDVLAGERHVKLKGTEYLPAPNPSDDSEENQERYVQFLQRAIVLGATRRTLDGMIGVAFRTWPEIMVPPKVDEVLDDIDGAGGALINQSRRALEENLAIGRGGLLVDYPSTGGAVSMADERERNIHATITFYRAEQIINWRTDDSGRVSLVVLHEMKEVPDGYDVDTVDQYRELVMEEGVYVSRLWRAGEAGIELLEEYTPTDGSGNPWEVLPFQFIGATDNDQDIDRAPLYDIASLNISHYRNSADYEESTHFNGQPTVAVSGLTQEWLDDVLMGQIRMGSRGGIPLPEGGQIALVQAAPNTLAGEAMKSKEDQMVALGARLMTPGTVAKTAEQSRAETAAAHSVLSLACDNVSAAYTQALRWVARFMNIEADDISFSIPTDFAGLQADPNLLTALVGMWQSGAIPQSDLWTSLRQLGIIDSEKTNEELQDEIEGEGGGMTFEPMPIETDDGDPAADPA